MTDFLLRISRAGRDWNVRFGSKADMCGAIVHVRFVPIADIGTNLVCQLFDDLVDAREEPRRHGEAERLGRLEVDHQLELGRLLDW